MTTPRPLSLLLSAALLTVALASGAVAEGKFIIVASTTSTQNSGLFAHILPLFQDKTGIEVRVVALGTGQALRLARKGDADVLFVHHKPSEQRFVAEGYGVKRFDVMFNDFIIVGPGGDPAGIRGMADAPQALKLIADTGVGSGILFVSRGDDSGTHKKELDLWRLAGIRVKEASGGWYRETGAGMGATLNTASAMNAYTLTDRGTWLSFGNKGALAVLVEGDERLFNQYGVILVDPRRHPHVKARLGQKFIDWLISAEGQAAIAGFKIGGQRLFTPNAGN